jgi:type I restriction enzyme, S subunit
MRFKGRLPHGWRLKPLSEMLSESRIPGSFGDSARKLTIRLYGRGVVPREAKRRGSRGTQYYRRRAGQFVYSKLDFLNGAFGLIPKELDGFETTLDVPAFDIDDNTDRHWLLAFLTQPWFYENCLHAARGGRKAKRVYESDFLRLEIPTPPLNHQKKIALVLCGVDDNIDRTRAVIEQTRKVKVSLLNDLLSSGIGHEKFKRTRIGRIPQKWRLDTIGSLCEFSSGTGFSYSDWSKQGLPIIRIQNLNGSTEFNFFSGEPDAKWIVEPGELLFAWAGVKGVSFGPCIWPGPRGLLNQHIYRIRANNDVDKRWLYAILGEVTHRIEAKAHGFKSSLVHVHKTDITNQLVAIPSLEEQTRIADRVIHLERWETSQVDYLKQLVEMRSVLSQGLLTGHIPVSSITKQHTKKHRQRKGE